MFHKFLVDENLAYENPMKLIQGVKLDKKIPEVLSIEEVVKWLIQLETDSVIGIRNKAILEVYMDLDWEYQNLLV